MSKNLKTISWLDGWKPQIQKFQELSIESSVKDSYLFQKNGYLMTRYDFENGEFVIMPHDMFEYYLTVANLD